jgi:hypothetical protein
MRKLDGSIGAVGDEGTAGVRVESRSQKLTRLANEAGDFDQEIQWAQSRFDSVVHEIKSMKPTKREIKSRNMQDFLDSY